MNLNSKNGIWMVHFRNVLGIFENFSMNIYRKIPKMQNFMKIYTKPIYQNFDVEFSQNFLDGDEIYYELEKIDQRGGRKAIGRIEQVCKQKKQIELQEQGGDKIIEWKRRIVRLAW